MEAAAVAIQSLMTQQRVALAMVKQTAEMQQQITDVLMASISGRGSSVDISV